MKKIQTFLFIFLISYTASTSVSIAQTYSGSPLQILATTTDTLTARFTLPELQLTTHPNSTEEGTSDLVTDVHFAGADWTLDVGKPRLPIYAQRIGIPVAGTP